MTTFIGLEKIYLNINVSIMSLGLNTSDFRGIEAKKGFKQYCLCYP